jgi:Tfp pilus assembly protein PilF
MWAERGENLDEARSLIQHAVDLEPKNAAYLDSLGWVLYKLKRPREALDAMNKAIALTEKPDPTLYEHLGDINLDLKNTAGARAAYTKSLEVKENAEIKKKLDSLTRE